MNKLILISVLVAVLALVGGFFTAQTQRSPGESRRLSSRLISVCLTCRMAYNLLANGAARFGDQFLGDLVWALFEGDSRIY